MPIAFASLAAWLVLAGARGRFWRADVDGHRRPNVPVSKARVEAIVPARDEAATIGRAIVSLADQSFTGPFAVTLVDDDSADGTRLVAERAVVLCAQARRLHVVQGRPLRAPWAGKLNALDTGVAHVLERRGSPDYWLFTDADIEHHPDNVSELVDKAERDGLDLVSLMVHLRCESSWERLLVPAFIFFFQKLYPFAWANDPKRATAAAAGGCMLVRASALERIGGLQSIGSELIDDCALAAAVKSSGGKTWIGLTSRAESLRIYGTLEPFWTMVKRSAFTQLDHSNVLTLGATLAMALLYLAPPGCVLAGIVQRDARATIVASIAGAVMIDLYLPTLRAYDRPKREAFMLPISASLYMAMTIDSAIAHARKRGGSWKGRSASRPL